MTDEAPLMLDVVPELAEEIERGLRDSGHADLAEQVAGLRMLKSCPCGDDFCATFRTVAVPEGLAGRKRWGIPLENHLIIHVLEGEIVEVEVLFRDDLRPKIRAVFGDEAEWPTDQEKRA